MCLLRLRQHGLGTAPPLTLGRLMRVRQVILAVVAGLTAIQVSPHAVRAQNIDFGRLLGGALQSAIEADRPRRRPEEQGRYIRERPPESLPGPLDDWRAAPQSMPMPQPLASIPPSSGPSQYLVEGQRVGTKVDLSGNNSDFRCAPSEAFPGQTWCQRKRTTGQKDRDHHPAPSCIPRTPSSGTPIGS